MRRAIPVLFALSLVPLLPASQEPVPTFEPTSNTGVVIVRNLVDNADNPESQTYTLVDTGVLP
jgi:hypothetical protein